MNCMENCGNAKKNTIVIFLRKNVCETLHRKKNIVYFTVFNCNFHSKLLRVRFSPLCMLIDCS